MPAWRSLLVALLIALGVGACSTRMPVAAVKAYHSCDYPKAISIFSDRAEKRDKDYVLYNLGILSSALRAGDFKTAEKAGFNAQQVMWSTAGSGKGTASLISAEAIKIFKGEPFEKAMASILSGIVYYNRGDYDNARAAFTKATMATAQKNRKYRQNFALPYLLQAKVFLKLGEEDNARIALKKARNVKPGNGELQLSHLKQNPTLILVGLGNVPEKVRSGPGKSLVSWKRKRYREKRAEIFVDGRRVGTPQEVGDLYVQATTKGWTGKDTVQVTKGVARDAAIVATVVAADEAAKGNKTAGWVALGTGLFALANQSQADIRQWELLPDRIDGLSLQLPRRRSKIEVRFYDRRNRHLSELDQVWFHDPGAAQADQIWWVRRGPCPAVHDDFSHRTQGKK